MANERISRTEPFSGSDGTSTGSGEPFTKIGGGGIGGKARGLAEIGRVITQELDRRARSSITVDIPRFQVLATDWFDHFMEKNRLYDLVLSDTKDRHVAKAFLGAELPRELVRELRKLISEVHAPLAVRSSSLLEDAIDEPFAGVYETKMVPNNQFSAESRLRTLAEAIKFVYASTFFRDAKSYREGLGRSHREEKMAVMIQEVIGLRHGDRFYPNISGVARSYNFYSFGNAHAKNGVVSLALGLGRTIVNGGKAWMYCPAHPRAAAPFGSTKELLNGTQTQFWSVNMGKPPTYDPILETEYLFEGDLRHAEDDGVLREIASTYDPESDRITMGTGSRGPRVLNFAPLLELDDIPLNDLIQDLMAICEEEVGNPAEIEFAVTINQDARNPVRFGFLQVRPMFVSKDHVEIGEHELEGEDVLVASRQVLGNGQLDSIRDIVYVMPDTFSASNSWQIAGELEEVNRCLLREKRPYLLIVFGRLGTSDPWLGVPVKWGQVSGAKVVIEASTSGMNVDMSQGSHFFHNVACLRILYFSTDRTGEHPLKWEWLGNRREERKLQFVRHVVLEDPLRIKVDGTSGCGVICHGRTDTVSD